MSRETGDRDYRPKRKMVQQRRTPGRSRPQVDLINYTDCESETESSAVLSDAEHTVVDFPTDTTDYTLETLWTPGI